LEKTLPPNELNEALKAVIEYNDLDAFKNIAENTTTEQLVATLKEVVKTATNYKFENILNERKGFYISPTFKRTSPRLRKS
jgi:hypothetical protein